MEEKLSPPKAIIFDLDGTLLETLEDIADCTDAVLREAGLPAPPRAQYPYYVGDGLRMLMRRCLGPGASQEELDLMLDKLRERYADGWGIKTRPYPGIPELLIELNARQIPLAVLSNKEHRFAMAMVRRFFPDIVFASVQGEQNGVPRKPDPTGASLIAERIGAAAAQTYFVGDTHTDMDTAAGAGMVAIGVAWGFRPESELKRYGARLILRRPDDLLPYL